MTYDVILVLIILVAAWVWATWPFTRETIRITADSLEGLGEWMSNEIFGKEKDEMEFTFRELPCQRCDQTIGEQTVSVVVEDGMLFWTCPTCHATNANEIVGVQSYE